MLLLLFEYSFYVNFFSCFKLTSWWELDQPTKINKSREWIIQNVLGDLQNHFVCRSVKKCTCNFAEVQFQRKTERGKKQWREGVKEESERWREKNVKLRKCQRGNLNTPHWGRAAERWMRGDGGYLVGRPSFELDVRREKERGRRGGEIRM